jgi:hypothetical protein
LEAIFTLAAAWFYIRAVHGRHDGTHPDGPRWRDFHHAAMAGALTWSIAATANLHTMGARDRGDMMTMHHHLAASATPDRDNVIATLGLTAYFVFAGKR